MYKLLKNELLIPNKYYYIIYDNGEEILVKSLGYPYKNHIIYICVLQSNSQTFTKGYSYIFNTSEPTRTDYLLSDDDIEMFNIIN
jgi:hypothetical protein